MARAGFLAGSALGVGISLWSAAHVQAAGWIAVVVENALVAEAQVVVLWEIASSAKGKNMQIVMPVTRGLWWVAHDPTACRALMPRGKRLRPRNVHVRGNQQALQPRGSH